jgi:thiol-disulfide isomerase/thioredoxin
MQRLARRRRLVRTRLVFGIAALAGAGAMTEALGQLPRAVAPGQPAPPLTGQSHPSAGEFSADWSGHKATLVNFWGTWCEPCRGEMRQLQGAYEKLRERGLQVIGVFEAGEADKVEAYLKEVPVTYPLVGIGTRVDRAWGGVGIKPTSFLVDATGKVLRRYVGAAPEQTQGMLADIEAVVDERPLGPVALPPEPKASEPPPAVPQPRSDSAH